MAWGEEVHSYVPLKVDKGYEANEMARDFEMVGPLD